MIKNFTIEETKPLRHVHIVEPSAWAGRNGNIAVDLWTHCSVILDTTKKNEEGVIVMIDKKNLRDVN